MLAQSLILSGEVTLSETKFGTIKTLESQEVTLLPHDEISLLYL